MQIPGQISAEIDMGRLRRLRFFSLAQCNEAIALVNPTDEMKAAQEGRVAQTDEDAYEAVSEIAPRMP